MSLLQKMRVNTALPLWVLNMPDECAPLFEGQVVKTGVAAKDKIQQVLLFAKDSKAMGAGLGKIKASLNSNFVGWIAYPKKSSGISTDLTRDDGWDVLTVAGFELVSSIAIDNTWTGMRFKVAVDRPAPGELKPVEGIDTENRIVTLPEDALKAMKPFKGLADFFYSLAFTHKKEYVESIVTAKKPETRTRRIEKMIEMVQALQAQKEAKKKK
ncbi:YdeI/OmpD-associated family protein [Chitinophagaceae bacterium MMS25-I14]